MSTSTQSGGPGRRPGVAVACQTPEDPRIRAFLDFVSAHDRHDLAASRTASKALRKLGYSVCLITPPNDRRGA